MVPQRTEPQHNPRSRLEKNYEFVTVENPTKNQDKEKRRLARTHAIKQAAITSRYHAQQRQENFRLFSVAKFEQRNSKRISKADSQPSRDHGVGPSTMLSPTRMDPFACLAVQSDRLQFFLTQKVSKRAGEPLFTLDESAPLRTISSVFPCGLQNAALCNGLLLLLTFSANNYSLDTESLHYRGETMRRINDILQSTKEILDEGVIGAILLLANVEYRLANGPAIQLHMNAIKGILANYDNQSALLTDGFKRALFWQDLDGALTVGTNRVFSHTTFPEICWARDPLRLWIYELPPGLDSKREFLNEGLVEVLEDLQAFRVDRDSAESCEHFATALHADSHQAWIESNLFHLRCEAGENFGPVTECIWLVSYICAYTLYTEIWGGPYIPPFLSKQLLHVLQNTVSYNCWHRYPDLFLWLTYMGGAFAEIRETRPGYLNILQSASFSLPNSPYFSWRETEACLKTFIWSDMFWERCRGLFEEVHFLGTVAWEP